VKTKREEKKMTNIDQELEHRFTKLMLSSVLRTLDALHPDINASETVHQNMRSICAGVRDRALQAVDEGGGSDAGQATAHVDTLIAMIDDFFAYTALPQFGELRVIESIENE
jgi:hypothetical protein